MQRQVTGGLDPGGSRRPCWRGGKCSDRAILVSWRTGGLASANMRINDGRPRF
jgi:hypothetical protein